MKSIERITDARLPLWIVAPALAIMLIVGIAGGWSYGRSTAGACPESAEVCERFTAFWRAWDIARDNFVDPEAVDPIKMTDGAIAGMLDSLGDEGHTRYLPPETARAEEESLSGRFQGIGAFVSERGGEIILQPIDGSPAQQAGIRPGDVVVRVDGASVEGLDSSQLAAKVRGPKGTNVTITVLHLGEELPVDITVTRDEITVPSTTWRMLPGNIAHISLSQFSEPASDDMKRALEEAQAQGATGIILDLRNNPGGLVKELVETASLLLPDDSTVLLEENRAGETSPYKTQGQPVAGNLPMVVLVNRFSASSAEILAGALKENGRATVVGVPTFGTATVLRPYNLGDGAQMRLGTTQWLTPNGEVVRGVGIQPNEVVALPADVQPVGPAESGTLTEQQLRESPDVQLSRAYVLLRGE